jgi:hypothetical protein
LLPTKQKENPITEKKGVVKAEKSKEKKRRRRKMKRMRKRKMMMMKNKLVLVQFFLAIKHLTPLYTPFKEKILKC